jgi:hypothetical protein
VTLREACSWSGDLPLERDGHGCTGQHRQVLQLKTFG